MTKSNAQRLAEASASPFIPKSIAAVMRSAAEELCEAYNESALQGGLDLHIDSEKAVSEWASLPQAQTLSTPTGQPVPFHSPDRPRTLPEVPRWLNDYGVLPGIYVKPTPDGRLDLEIFVPRGFNSFQSVSRIISKDELDLVIADYETWPEAAIAKWFGCALPAKGAESAASKTKPAAVSSRKISLADLDL